MKIDIIRIHSDEYATIGCLYIDGKLECFTLENGVTEVKKPGRSRIPNGVYELTLRNEPSPKREHYRNKYKWFKNHIMLKDVPNFNYIYIHVGNTTSDTDGCILIGDAMYTNVANVNKAIGNSVLSFKRFYSLVYPILESGKNKVTLTIKDLTDEKSTI